MIYQVCVILSDLSRHTITSSFSWCISLPLGCCQTHHCSWPVISISPSPLTTTIIPNHPHNNSMVVTNISKYLVTPPPQLMLIMEMLGPMGTWVSRSSPIPIPTTHDGSPYPCWALVSVQFTQVWLGKHIIWTVCPNQFCGKDGLVPPGSVAIMVTGHNKGLGIQHLVIPGHFLSPASPAGKNHLCLVLKGAKARRVMWIRECWRKTTQVVMEKGNIFSFSDICAVFEFNKNVVH